MTKILLVEDDKSLREIYGVRLLAEGYDIVSAGDGEEALAVAIREKPDLVVSDVMMPRISGFEMLDLLRGNEATKNVKVIMMTALSSDQQRERGESLGADRYLVKSQVGIEDMVQVVHEVLGDREKPLAAQELAQNQSPINPLSATLPSAATETTPPNLPERPLNVPSVAREQFAPDNTDNINIQSSQQQPAIQPTPLPNIPQQRETISQPQSNPTPGEQQQYSPNTPQQANNPPDAYQPAVNLANNSGSSGKIIQPVGAGVSPKIDIDDLLAKEDANSMGLNPANMANTNSPETAPSQPVSQSNTLDIVDAQSQIDNINDNLPPVDNNPTISFPTN